MSVKYPDVKVKLVGEDGNAFAIIGRIQKAMRRAKIDEGEIKEFVDDAMSGNYDHLLQVAMKTVSVH